VLNECRPGADADRRAAGQQNFLQRQWAVVVVCQLGAEGHAAKSKAKRSECPIPSTPGV
jgi:hypothetical protein